MSCLPTCFGAVLLRRRVLSLPVDTALVSTQRWTNLSAGYFPKPVAKCSRSAACRSPCGEALALIET
eukprot:4990890-Amphidinium_carterae.1